MADSKSEQKVVPGHQSKLRALLARSHRCRDPIIEPRNQLPLLTELQRWQMNRLQKSYADLLAQPRYAKATRYFLDDLYGDRDFAQRDRDLERIVPIMTRLLPGTILDTLACAFELNALSHELDLDIAEKLSQRLGSGKQALATVDYVNAYADVGRGADRERQIDLIAGVGLDLDQLVGKPLLWRLLKLLRGPAYAAGLGDLQSFLERGFAAFRAMQGADEFLETVERRERAALERLLARDVNAFG